MQTSYVSVILQGAEHSSFDPREIRSLNLPSGLWDYLRVGARALAPRGIRASRSALCQARSIFVTMVLSIDSLDNGMCSKAQNGCNLYCPPKAAVHQCEEKDCDKFYVIGNTSAWLSFH